MLDNICILIYINNILSNLVFITNSVNISLNNITTIGGGTRSKST